MDMFDARRFGGRVLAVVVAVGSSLALTLPSGGFETEPGSSAASAGLPPLVVAQAATQPTFSAEQLANGERRFERECAECHGMDLRGGLLGGPPLRGQAFLEKFGNGAPASALFYFMSGAMPPDQPGRFSTTAYIELLAYVLAGNGFQEGAPLPTDPAGLDLLIVGGN